MKSRPLRIFSVVNHLGNSYEQLKLAENYDVEFTYLRQNVRRWGRTSHRPMPEHLNWVSYYEPGKYDVAILSVDQQCIDPQIGKGHIYRQLNDVIQDIPKIVINHGTPMWDERYTEDLVINGGDVFDKNGKPNRLDGMKALVGDNFMIVNSYESVNRWGWGYPLIHGMTEKEWLDLPKEPMVVLPLSPAGLDKYYNRQLISNIKDGLPDRTGFEVVHTNVNYAVMDWQDYKETLGRALITIFPFKDSPMPRSRTEAMLSGSCVLSSRYHNADEFIKNGVNGFIMPDNPLSYIETIDQLINHNYRDTVAIGERGRATAMQYFSEKAYQADFYDILTKVAAGTPPTWSGRKRWQT
jgi:glycosyltransferase involved in cell wall biosynthesis